MASPSRPAGTVSLSAESDWTNQVADAIDNAVSTVRDKTVVPAEKVVRIIVAGMLVGVLGGVAAVLLAISFFRGLAVALPEDVWLAYLVVGGIFTVAGLFCWSRR
ncbi:MAG: phage holin family protein [Acidimicrobiia bacterium]